MSGVCYVELQCTSHFSFLRGASSCDELFAQAATLGLEALAIVDRNSLAGIVRAHEAGPVCNPPFDQHFSGVRLRRRAAVQAHGAEPVSALAGFHR